MTLEGSCHCGRTVVRLLRAPASVTHCNCSLCAKTGFRGIYGTSDELEIVGEFDAYVREDIGEPFLKTMRCKSCGVITHWEPLTPPPHDRMGVNARLFDPRLIAGAEVREVDGASW